MNYLLANILCSAVVVAVCLSPLKLRRKNKTITCEVENNYREIMCEIAVCESLAELISCQSKINAFKDYDSWRVKDGCDMVDSLQDYYNEVYDSVAYEQYSF